MTHSLNESALILGIAADNVALVELVDSLICGIDSYTIRDMLHKNDIPWIESYTKVFKFETEYKQHWHTPKISTKGYESAGWE